MTDVYERYGLTDEQADYLRRLYQLHGKLTKEILADDSVDPSSPFHAEVWSMSDEEAAWEHRLEICARIVRKAKIRIVEAETKVVKARAREWVNESPGNGWSPYLDVVQDPDRRSGYALGLKKRMASLADELRAVDAFAAVADAIDQALNSD